jgi:hypothetical protein
MDGHFMPTTTRGVVAGLDHPDAHARQDPPLATLHVAAIAYCTDNPDFTDIHMRTFGTQSAATLPTHAQALFILIIVDLVIRARTTRGELLRNEAQEALLFFPTSVLGPQRPGASSSSVKAEVNSRLDLWRRGHIDEQAKRAKAMAAHRPVASHT